MSLKMPSNKSSSAFEKSTNAEWSSILDSEKRLILMQISKSFKILVTSYSINFSRTKPRYLIEIFEEYDCIKATDELRCQILNI